MRALRAFTGVVAAGVVVLTLIVVVAAVLAARRSVDGPGAGAVVAHVLAAVVVVGAQVLADRQRRPSGVAVGSGVVLVVSGVLLWSQWLA